MTPPAVLTIRDLRVEFGGVRALDLSRLDIPATPGIAAVFMGPNGAGKTTMLNAISRWTTVQPGGCVSAVLKTSVDCLRKSRWGLVRAGVSRTFQASPVFPSVKTIESIQIAARASVGHTWLTRAASLLRPLHTNAVAQDLVRRIVRLLELETITERFLSDLPVRLLRRVELARCLATQPRLLLLDEPTAGADEEEVRFLAQLLAVRLPGLVPSWSKEDAYRFPTLTCAIVTHDLRFVRALDSLAHPRPFIHVLSEGHLLASGSLDQILENRDVRTAYLGSN